MHAFPDLDAEYATAVQDSYAVGRRLDDALARLDGGFVDPNTFYVQTKPAQRIGTPLVFALLDNALVYVDALIARGADPNVTFRDEEGIVWGPALFFVRSVECLERLVAGGADLSVQRGGETYLHHCVRMTRVSRHPVWATLASAAIRLGANPKQPDARGVDAIAFASEMGVSVAKVFAPIFGVEVPKAPAKAPEKSAGKPAAARKRIPK